MDESLAAIDRDPAGIGADVPQVEEFRRQLLARAESFYVAFMDQEPRSERARRDLALAHLRLGHINRMLEKRDDAEREYHDAIARLDGARAGQLAGASRPTGARDGLQLARRNLAGPGRQAADAAAAYDRALELQQALVATHPGNAVYQDELARTH